MWRDAANALVDLERERFARRVEEDLLSLARTAERAASTLPHAIADAGLLCAEALRDGHKVLVCGNGGSAADASHFVAELVGRMGMERAPLAAISLSVDPSVVTCIANDYGYEQLFARQVEGLGRPGDVLIAISTSGRSRNVLAALESARRTGMQTVALVAAQGDPSLDASDVVIRAPSPETPRIQEIHTAALHAICDVIERALFTSGAGGGTDRPSNQ